MPNCTRKTLGELVAGGQRGAAVAGGSEPFDQPAVGRLGERVERHLSPGQPDDLRRIVGEYCGLLEGTAKEVRVLIPCLERPLFVEAVEDRGAACLERADRIAVVERLPEGARVDADVRPLERDRVTCGHDNARRRPQRLPQLSQRHAQAGPRRFVEHVGPEARRKPAARLRAGVEREIREHAARPLRRRSARSAPPSVRSAKPPASRTSSIGPTVVHRAASAQADGPPFTEAERCANGRPGRSAHVDST